MNFVPSDLRRRHDFIDRSIESYIRLLVAARSGGEIPESTYADHKYILDRLTIPNLRDNTLEMGQRALQAEDFIPIWAMKPGEAVRTSAKTIEPHPSQKERQRKLLKKHGKHGSGKVIRNFLENNQYQVAIRNPDETAAVFAPPLRVNLGKNAVRYFATRPLIVLNNVLADTSKQSRTAPDGMGHEFEHVRQSLAEPISRFDTMGDMEDARLRRELEAYALQERLIKSMMKNNYQFDRSEAPNYWVSNGKYVSLVSAVNNMRRAANASREKDPFFPDGQLRKDLANKGLHIYGKPPMTEAERSKPINRPAIVA